MPKRICLPPKNASCAHSIRVFSIDWDLPTHSLTHIAVNELRPLRRDLTQLGQNPLLARNRLLQAFSVDNHLEDIITRFAIKLHPRAISGPFGFAPDPVRKTGRGP